ncbi:MAG: diguanylate cyclase, partial [Planctomycetota bacterium]
MTDKDTDPKKLTALQQRLERRTRTIDLGGPNPKRIFDQVSIVAVVMDTGLRIVRFNRAAERLFGVNYVDVLGRPFDECLTQLTDVNADHAFQRTIALGVPTEVKEVPMQNPEDEKFFFNFVVDPILDDDAQMAGIAIVGLDVTERVKLRRRISDQNEDLMALQQVSNALRTTMDLDRAFFIIASALTSHEGGAYDHAMIFTVDQDRENLVGQICVDSIGLRDVWGIWRGMMANDAPFQKELEAAQPVLAKRWGELSKVVHNVRVPVKDSTSILIHAIQTGDTVTHRTMADDSKLHLHESIAEHFPMKNFAAAPLLADKEAIGVIVVDSSSRPRDFTPERLTLLEMFANQAALAINNGIIFQNVLDRAQRDSLTRLYNHGHFQEALRTELEKAQRYDQPLSLIMLDIDHFKNFNDTWGHQIGDMVLKQTALLLSALVRVTDLPARYGGEEFAILLPQTEHAAAVETAERLRNGIDRKIVVAGPKGKKIGVTASFGVATFDQHAPTADSLVAVADESLYLAKERGRNCVVSANDI